MARRGFNGKRLQQLMRAAGLSAAQLAERLGVSPQAVSQWLSDDTTPNARRLPMIAEALGVDLSDLMRSYEPVAIHTVRGRTDETQTWMFEVGKRIKEIRELGGYSIPDVAQLCAAEGFPAKSLVAEWHLYEAGEALMNPLTLECFCARMRVTFDYLLRGLIKSEIDEDLMWKLLARHPELLNQLAWKDRR